MFTKNCFPFILSLSTQTSPLQGYPTVLNLWVAWWPRGWCSQLQIEQSGFKPCPGTLPCVLGRDIDKFNAGVNPGIDQHPIQCFLVSHFLLHVVLHTMYSIGTNGVKFNIMIHCAAPKYIHTCPPLTERIGVSLGGGGGAL